MLDAVLDAERLGATARNHTARAAVRLRAGERLDNGADRHVAADRAGAGAGRRGADDVRRVDRRGRSRREAQVRPARYSGRRAAISSSSCPTPARAPASPRSNSRNEPLYCIPWKQYHYFGPTETPYEGDPDRVFVTVEEADGIIAEANKLLPGLRLTPADIRISWAGVRPLTYDPAVPFGNRSRVIHDLAAEGLAVCVCADGRTGHDPSLGRTRIDAAGGATTASPRARHDHADYAPPAERCGAEHAATLSDELFRRRGTAWSGPADAEDREQCGNRTRRDACLGRDPRGRRAAPLRGGMERPLCSAACAAARGLHRPNVTTTGIQQDA